MLTLLLLLQDDAFLVAGQVGYDSEGEKQIIAASRAPREWPAFEVCDAQTHAVVFSIPRD